MVVATKSRCGSCNCNELSPRHLRRSGNRFSSLRCGPMTIMLATLMIFSCAAEAVDSDMVPSHYGGDLEQTIRDSVKNEIEMDLDREAEKATAVLSIEYPDKEISNNVVITQTDSDSSTIVVNGETVREVRNLHEDSDKNIDLAVVDERESPEEEVQSVEKQEKVEEPKAVASQSSASSSSSSESENAAGSVETSENLIEKDSNDVVQKSESKEETEKLTESQNVLEETLGEQIKPEILEEEAKSSVEAETLNEQGVGGESIREEPTVQEEVVKEEEGKVNEEVVKEEKANEEVVKEEKVNEEPVKEEAVEGLVPGKVAADDEAPEIPLDIEENIIDDEADSEDQKPISVEETKTLAAPSDIAEFLPTPETEIKAEEPVKAETFESAESSNSLVGASESQHKEVEEKKEEVTEKTSENAENPLDKQPIQEDSNEEVLSVVLNENATIMESPQSSSFEPEHVVPVKVEETAEEQAEVEDEPVPPQEPEHTVIKKQGVDLQQEEEGQEDDGELAEGTSRPEEEETDAESANAIQGEELEVKEVQGEEVQEVKMTESEFKNEQPEDEVQKKEVKEEQEAKVEEQEVKAEEQEVKNEEPAVKEEEPAVNVVDTEVKDEEPKVQGEPEVEKEPEVKKEDNQISNETDLGEADDNTYDDDEELGQPEGEISQNEAQPTPKQEEGVPAAEKTNQIEDVKKQDEQAAEEKQDASATEPVVVETEATIAAFTSEKSSSLVSEESAAATMFESFQPRNAGQRFNNNVLTAESGMGKALETRSINETPTYRSSVIIALCSGVAVLFVLISVTIFIISFQRQHGTLDIEMQEKRCGKDDRDDDPESCLKLLDIELPITMLPAAVVMAPTERTTPKTSMIIMEERGEGEEAVPMNTTLHSDDIDETL